MKYLKIGFLDSGIGGLAYLEAFKNQVKSLQDNHGLVCDCIYLADNKHFPYGEQDIRFLESHLLELAKKYIKSYHLDILVLACNTASLLIVDTLRQELVHTHVKIVGTVPAIKPAVETGAKHIYVMNTNVTSHTEYAKNMASKTKELYGYESKVFLRACQELVNIIEKMVVDDRETYHNYMITLLDNIVNEIVELECEVVVLGCTHFLLIKQEIKKLLPKSIIIIDSLEGVTNRIIDISIKSKENAEVFLSETDLQNRFLCTSNADEEKFKKIASTYNMQHEIF